MYIRRPSRLLNSLCTLNLSVIRQKGKYLDGGNKKTKHGKFSEKQTFFTPDKHMYVCVSEGKKC